MAVSRDEATKYTRYRHKGAIWWVRDARVRDASDCSMLAPTSRRPVCCARSRGRALPAAPGRALASPGQIRCAVCVVCVEK